MTFRDILVQVNETPASRPRATAAAEIAKRSGGVVTGVYLRSEFLNDIMATEVLAYMSPLDIDALLKDHAKAVGAAAEAAREIFENAAAEAGVTSNWLTIGGDDEQSLITCARRANLVVLPPVVTVTTARWKYPAANLAMAVGGPVLVVGEDGCAPDFGRRVLVAWNGSRESARALRDAWSVLRAAERVDVVIVSLAGDDGPDGLLQRHLERHDCKATIILDPGKDEVASEVLRRQAAELGSDLLVMGLFGRPRVQEMVLGGVSREMLAAPPIPLLISH
jgi:nucleotide-binding universal stress UspA family protein